MIRQALSKLYSPESQEEKRKDYRNVVAAQAILLIISLLTDDWLNNTQVTFFLFQLCCIVYLGLIWDLSRNFTFKRWLPRLLGLLSIVVVSTSLVYNYLFWDPVGGVTVNCLLHGVTVGIQAVVIGLGLRDLVHGPRNAADKLWAAAGLYIMLGIAFGELIHFVHLIRPDTLGPHVRADVIGFHEALYVSFATLTGADNELNGVSHFCRNLLAMESLLAQLYVVMLISRLLASDDVGVEEGSSGEMKAVPESVQQP
ncbi:MAG: hypothetical protein J0I12_00290 [Candidatus Eremiobacteraeota bacterium]|nr:hypothetical protein [Candidatus Eremiobacteraeota bacterium]